MGSLLDNLYINEADDDADNKAAGNDTPAANNEDTGAKSADDDTDTKDDTDNKDDQTDDKSDEDTDAKSADDDKDNDDAKKDDNADDQNFDIDASDDTADKPDDNTSDDKPEENPDVDNPAKKKDREIFDDLTPEEQKVKNIKLKELYLDFYSKCETLIDKYNKIGTDNEEYSKPIKKILNILYDLKNMESDYLLNLFDSKTYIENDIMFNSYLTILNSIKIITAKLVKTAKNDNNV